MGRPTREAAGAPLRTPGHRHPDVPPDEGTRANTGSPIAPDASELDAEATLGPRVTIQAEAFAYAPRRSRSLPSPNRESSEGPRTAHTPERVRPEGRMRRRASLVLNLMFFVFILTAGAVVAAPMIPVMLGYRTMVVVSGSMEPEIGVGDAVVIDRQAPRDVRVGDVITFQPFGAQELKTHRVLAISRIDDHIYFQTKGDANDTPDPDLADSRAVVGTVRMHVPEVGRFLLYSSHPRVRLVLIGLPALLLMFQQGAALVRGRRRDPETAPPPLAAHPRRGRRAQAATSSWLLVLVIAVTIARSAGVATAPEPAWALSTDSIALGDNTFATSAQFGP